MEWHEDVSVGVLPGVDVGAHRGPVSVWRGDGDGELSPRGQRWSAQSGASHCPRPHFLSSQPQRVTEQLSNSLSHLLSQCPLPGQGRSQLSKFSNPFLANRNADTEKDFLPHPPITKTDRTLKFELCLCSDLDS